MTYAVILAGGTGSRMGGDKPKQYLCIKGKPIIIYTIEKFIACPGIDRVLVLCPAQWEEHTKDLIKKYLSPAGDMITVARGGETRNETIMNAVDIIEREDGLDGAVIITHDSVRPFVTHRIIADNIEACKKYDACDTVIPATDTIVEARDGELISNIPNRGHMYQGQTPQSFNASKLKELYLSLSDEEKAILTDAAKIFVLKGEPVALVNGETFNIKITYPYDMRVARALLEDEEE